MDNLRGAAFMVLAMFCFTLLDTTIKILSEAMPVFQALALISTGILILLIGWSLFKGIALWHPDCLNRRVILRSLAEVAGTSLICIALALIPLTTASAVIQATPLVVAMGAGLFLGQSIGWRRWIAIIVGFAGVLLIVRPGLDGFDPAVLLVVTGMLALASRDLLTRGLNVSLTGVQLGIHAFAFVLPGSLVLMLVQRQPLVSPEAHDWLIVLFGAFIGVASYLTIITATRTGNAGVISSFRYSRMIFALVIGYLVFDEWPDAATLIGAFIIIASGIFTLWREARLRRASLAAAAAL
ncbi:MULTISPECIES: DMT family transporter [unclassified Yoonia]|uniref:DMT family transporter n=1 Tax=unclassified Yoonia TaxID=2629118 RepID=UPI002AFE6598|nr:MULTISPECIES: DMT family transporter [unclassified Yoonia]